MREDAILLYGFATRSRKTGVRSVDERAARRAKLALAVLSVLSPEDLVSAITHEDVERLDAVPGVGAKVAERIVRELRDKIGGAQPDAPAQIERLPPMATAGLSSLARRRGLGTGQSRLQTGGGQARG